MLFLVERDELLQMTFLELMSERCRKWAKIEEMRRKTLQSSRKLRNSVMLRKPIVFGSRQRYVQRSPGALVGLLAKGNRFCS